MNAAMKHGIAPPKGALDPVNKHKVYKKGMGIFVAGLSSKEREQLINARKCMLCKDGNHEGGGLNVCPLRDSMYKAGTYFSFYRDPKAWSKGIVDPKGRFAKK
jgi:hypothetical protein